MESSAGRDETRPDQSLMQEQIELITKWVDGGIRRGNNPRQLPKEPVFTTVEEPPAPRDALRIQGPFTLSREMVLDGMQPERVATGRSMRIVALLPGGSTAPLLWLHGYDTRYSHPFLLRRPLPLPAGTIIRGVDAGAVIALLPAAE
jgi:hypothetical protein